MRTRCVYVGDVPMCVYVYLCRQVYVRVTHSTRSTRRLPMCLCQCVMWCACDVPMRVCDVSMRVRDESMMM